MIFHLTLSILVTNRQLPAHTPNHARIYTRSTVAQLCLYVHIAALLPRSIVADAVWVLADALDVVCLFNLPVSVCATYMTIEN